MSQEPRVHATARSHEGRVRTNNEDSFCDRTADRMWAVADGMGGHEFGERASGAIVDALHTARMPADLRSACEEMSEAIHRANTTIWQESQQRGTQCGSTVVCLVMRGKEFAVMWVGDSRAYLMRGDQLYQLSRDHTQVQEMVDRGLMQPHEAEDHPMSHVLARAVGVRDILEVEAFIDEVEPGDVFLLCSDGLSGVLSEAEITGVLRGADDAEAVDQLIQMTLDRGAPDNVTAIVVTTQESTQLTFQPSSTVLP